MRSAAVCATLAAAGLEAQVAPEGPAETVVRDRGFRLGRVIVQPRFDFGGIGWESNVYLVGEGVGEERNDLFVSGGPGLGLIVPITPKLRFLADSRLNYQWYADTVDQRRLTGGADGRFVFNGGPVRLTAGYAHYRTFERPVAEIGRRIETTRAGPVGSLGFSLPGRLQVDLDATYRDESSPDDEPDVLGNDVARRLSRATLEARPRLGYAITPKTSVFVEAPFRREIYDAEDALDADTWGYGVGVQTDSSTLVPGVLRVGIQRYDANNASTPPRDSVYAELRVQFGPSPRTRFEPSYRRQRETSLLRTLGDTQTLVRDELGLRIVKELVTERVDLRVNLQRAAVQTDGGGVVLDFGAGSEQVQRDEIQYLAEGDLGYRFRALRVGLVGSWRNRTRTAFASGGRAEGFTLGLSASLRP
jgi:opacity protein-like surface antigen